METSDLLSRQVRQFIADTSAKTPTPGGGSVAGVVGALGTALGEMALSFTRGKKKFAQHEDLYERAAGRLARARGMFQDLVSDDVEAFTLYQQASQMPDGPDKARASQVATAAAIDVPREMAKLALAVMEELRALADKCNPYLVSDLLAAAALAAAVTRLSDYNVRINSRSVGDAQAAVDLRTASAGDVTAAAAMLDEIERLAAPSMA